MAVRVAGVGKQVNRRTDFGPLRTPRKKSTDSMRNLAAGAAATASAGVEFSQVSASVAISSPNEDICSGRPAFLSAVPLSASSQCAKIEPPISLMKLLPTASRCRVLGLQHASRSSRRISRQLRPRPTGMRCRPRHRDCGDKQRSRVPMLRR